MDGCKEPGDLRGTTAILGVRKVRSGSVDAITGFCVQSTFR